jgi:hypothetical protein
MLHKAIALEPQLEVKFSTLERNRSLSKLAVSTLMKISELVESPRRAFYSPALNK